MPLDDLLFYLPGYASIPLIAAGILLMWLVFRLLAERRKRQKKTGALEKTPKI